MTDPRWSGPPGILAGVGTKQLHYGWLVLLIIVVALVAGAAVEAVRAVPDPNLFTRATGSVVAVIVTAVVVAAAVLRPPPWLTSPSPRGSEAD